MQVAPGNGCVYLTDCEQCTDSKCVAMYSMSALESVAESRIERAVNESVVCSIVTSFSREGSFILPRVTDQV